jgi:acylphosphatase
MEESEKARLHAIVEGQVQGVGFRMFVLRNADTLNLTGWVRNRGDGNVEVLAEGARPAVEKLLTALHAGPRASFVTHVQTEWLPATGEFTRFQARQTE